MATSRSEDRALRQLVAEWEWCRQEAMRNGLPEKVAVIAADYATGVLGVYDAEAWREYQRVLRNMAEKEAHDGTPA
jgi:hypothetical protein